MTAPIRFHTDDRPVAEKRFGSSIRIALRRRLHGPGGLYNLGNLIALATGIALQFTEAASGAGTSIVELLNAYFFGSPGASWLTLAIAIFLVAGEVYHRAWKDGAPPDIQLNRMGDILSFLGAMALTASLIFFGDVVLALVSGTLLAGGKLGTAIVPEDYGMEPARNRLPRAFRLAVVISRAPALIGLTIELFRQLAHAQEVQGVGQIVAPVIMFGCYLIWARADLLLLKAGSTNRVSLA